MKYCPRCRRVFEDEIVYCLDDHSILHPKPDPGDQQPVAEKVLLDDRSLDRFSRSLCPKCDAWKNWRRLGSEYQCLSCEEVFIFDGSSLYGSPGKSLIEKRREIIESSPILSVLDNTDGNSNYWMRQFEAYESIGSKGWNWPTFFFGAQWYFWKGMWQKGLLISILYAAMWFLFAFLMTSAAPWIDPVAFFIIIILFWGYEIYLARLGTGHYYKYLKDLSGDLRKARRNKVVGRIIFVVFMLSNPLSNCHVQYTQNQREIVRDRTSGTFENRDWNYGMPCFVRAKQHQSGTDPFITQHLAAQRCLQGGNRETTLP